MDNKLNDQLDGLASALETIEEMRTDAIVEKVVKKLTLRLDKDNVDLLNKLEKRFPSLSQNQILNQAIVYAAENMFNVVGEGNAKDKNKESLVLSSIGRDNVDKDLPLAMCCALAEKSAFVIKSDKLVFINSKGEEFVVMLKKDTEIKVEKK